MIKLLYLCIGDIIHTWANYCTMCNKGCPYKNLQKKLKRLARLIKPPYHNFSPK